MEKETEIIEDGDVSESLKVALQKEREEKKREREENKALKERIAELEKATSQKTEEVKPKAEPEKVDMNDAIKEAVRSETFEQEKKRYAASLASNDAERTKMEEFMQNYKGVADAAALAKMAKAAVNADSFIGDVGEMAKSTGLLSSGAGGVKPAPADDEIEITELQYQHMRALGYKDRESMKAAIKKFEAYNK